MVVKRIHVSSYTWMVAMSPSSLMISPTSSLWPTRTSSYMAAPAMAVAVTTMKTNNQTLNNWSWTGLSCFISCFSSTLLCKISLFYSVLWCLIVFMVANLVRRLHGRIQTRSPSPHPWSWAACPSFTGLWSNCMESRWEKNTSGNRELMKRRKLPRGLQERPISPLQWALITTSPVCV